MEVVLDEHGSAPGTAVRAIAQLLVQEAQQVLDHRRGLALAAVAGGESGPGQVQVRARGEQQIDEPLPAIQALAEVAAPVPPCRLCWGLNDGPRRYVASNGSD